MIIILPSICFFLKDDLMQEYKNSGKNEIPNHFTELNSKVLSSFFEEKLNLLRGIHPSLNLFKKSVNSFPTMSDNRIFTQDLNCPATCETHFQP
jgi:hypothetical protein